MDKRYKVISVITQQLGYVGRGERREGEGGVTTGDPFGGQTVPLRRVHDLQNVKFNRTHKCVAAILNAMRHKKEGSTFSPS